MVEKNRKEIKKAGKPRKRKLHKHIEEGLSVLWFIDETTFEFYLFEFSVLGITGNAICDETPLCPIILSSPYSNSEASWR